jgi:hypothetical protein
MIKMGDRVRLAYDAPKLQKRTKRHIVERLGTVTAADANIAMVKWDGVLSKQSICVRFLVVAGE